MALVVETFFLSALRSLPITLDLGTWYAGSALTSLGLLIGLVLLGFYRSLSGKPLFAGIC
ncbi:MAG: hypothetical protein ABI672_15375 [Vicinamibacteria bacterium]